MEDSEERVEREEIYSEERVVRAWRDSDGRVGRE